MKNKNFAVCFGLITIALLFLSTDINAKNDNKLKNKIGKTTVFKDINVFDGFKLIKECTVVIQDSIIVEVGQHIKIPRDAEIISGNDLTLIPGLIDAHVHIVSLRDLEQSAIFGVTTVLDMMTTTEFMQQARSRVKNPKNKDMADFFSSGQPATYPGGHGTEWGTEIPTLTKVEDVKSFMDASISSGVDYIKIMSGLGKKVISKDIVATVAKESSKRGLLTVVHIETYSKAFEAISAGVNGLGHCFADTLPDDILINLMKEKKAFIIPTLSVMNSLPDAKKVDIFNDERLYKLIVPEILVGLKNDRPYRGYKQLKYKNAEESVRILHNAGIPILAGTDSYNPGTVHGASMHGELELLTYAGLSPLDALISATSLTAKTFGSKDRGRIAKGMRADLLLVKGDPTKNITDTRNIEDVWINGKKVDRVPWINKIEKQQKEWNETGEVPGPIGSESGLISNFESGDLITEFGIFFFAISDKFFGGSSQSLIKYSNQCANNSSGSLLISGKVDCSKPKAWSGAAFFPSAMEFTIANLSGWNAVSFDAKGDTDSIMVMFMLSDQRIPVSKNFKLTNEWKKFTIPFNELGSESGKNIVGMIFGSNSCSGEFSILIDNLKLTNQIVRDRRESSGAGVEIDIANQYLGQKPPGLSPEVFAPGLVSTPEFLEIGCTWSPDGKEFYFVRQSNTGGILLCSKWEENGWTAPEEVEQFKKFPGFEPFISADGKKFFYTRFALPPDMAKNSEKFSDQQKQESMANIWVMNKNGLDFGDPEFCAPGMFSSASKNGNLYTTIITGEKPGIYRYLYNEGKYAEKEFLGGGVNSPVMGAHPCIAPDESFIVFDSKRKDDPEDTDLYVCYRQKDGTWSQAYWLGDQVNTKWNDICPALSPDGKYLFYMSKADIYWVSTEIIEKLNPKLLE